MRRPLFRAEALSSKRLSPLGKVILIQPLSFYAFTACAVTSALAILIFSHFIEYSKRIQVAGILLPHKGFIKIQSPRLGMVIERRVQEGQHVRTGDVLYVLSDESMSSDTKKYIMITAPQSGTVAVMSGELGQMMSKQTILTVLPENSTLEAQLFVPGSAVGFIKLGDKLGLRITAYPYLKFGKVDGTVTELSQTSISAQEMPSQLSAAKQSALNGNGEAMFRVKIALSKQTISVYGTHKPMLSGMDVETEIVQERRSLLGWVLEPLYRFKENL